MLNKELSGLIVIDKPKGYTSFDVVAVMRKITKQKKMGHTGTLDPLATGVLPMLLGSATKAQDLIPNSDKEYVADFVLGIKTDTQDISGTVVEKKRVSVDLKELKRAINSFQGNINQVPPMYSALKKDGKRLYDLARSGITVEREARKINIYNIELLSFEEENVKATMKVSCSKGTYIRTLCNDIGEKLGCGATLTELRRTKACGFNLDNSISLTEVEKLAFEDQLDKKIIGVDKLFEAYERVNISYEQSQIFNNGGRLLLERTDLNTKLDFLSDGQFIRVYSNDNIFLGLAFVCLKEKSLRVKKRF